MATKPAPPDAGAAPESGTSAWEGHVLTLDELKSAAKEKLAPVAFNVPGYGQVVLRGLSVMERDIALDAARTAGGSGFKIMTAVAAQGLVQPKVTAKVLGTMPNEFVQPIYDEIMRITSPDEKAPDDAGADGPAPFPIGSGSSSFWLTD
jgi:hypothetical protein